MARGLFITFEGPEGAGKTTQAHLLGEELRRAGREVQLTREPGGDPLAESIRALLQNPELTLVPRAELLLFLAARAQHVERVIRPALEAGKVVLCDRFADSTVAYQSYGVGLPQESVHLLNRFATGGLEPDLTLLLDLDVSLGLQRQGDWSRMELRGVEFHRRVRAGFLALAKEHPERIRVLDASRPVPEVARDIWACVEALLHERS
ncbi:MAG TPA: dTMP kinase [Armatimonadetes bacterium]|nr:dTMP kinase [Armatimonadota bacterium]